MDNNRIDRILKNELLYTRDGEQIAMATFYESGLLLLYSYKGGGLNMDKQEAIKRLDALEGEAKKLREIIERGDKIVYDKSKIYVGIKYKCPYVMTGEGHGNGNLFRFHSFDGIWKAVAGWIDPQPTGQKCLDYHLADGFAIHAFDDTREAFQFFIDNLK
jgi:hypothetical protein